MAFWAKKHNCTLLRMQTSHHSTWNICEAMKTHRSLTTGTEKMVTNPWHYISGWYFSIQTHKWAKVSSAFTLHKSWKDRRKDDYSKRITTVMKKIQVPDWQLLTYLVIIYEDKYKRDEHLFGLGWLCYQGKRSFGKK